MSLALFRSQLRSAVREARIEDATDRPEPRVDAQPAPTPAEVLRRVARGEISAREALNVPGEAP